MERRCEVHCDGTTSGVLSAGFQQLAERLAERANGVAQLIIPQIRRRSHSQDVASRVGMDAALAEAMDDVFRGCRSNREEAAAALVGHRLHARGCGRDVELLELGLQQTDLMLADRSQPAGRQTLLFVKGEHRRRSVV